MSSFNERIKELRREREMSQRQVAERIGYSQQNISDWEAGRIQPTALAIIACAHFFEVSCDYLLGLESDDGTKIDKNASAEPCPKNNDERELLDAFKKLTKTNKTKLIGISIGLFESQQPIKS